MAQTHVLVAVDTYGKTMLSSSSTERVHTLKCTRIIAEIILSLFGDLAQDLTPPHSQNYRYIALDPLPALKKNYLVLRLTLDEQARIEVLCRASVFHWVFLWRAGKWWEFPSRDHPDYRDVKASSSLSYPHFPAGATPFVTPSRCIAQPAMLVDKTGEDYPVMIQATTPIITDVEPTAVALVGKDDSAAVQLAIAHLNTLQALVVRTPTSTRQSIASIGQAYVGELTGSISGNVHCYGYAVHEGVAVYINMGGPRMAVEAIRAKLSKGDIVNLVPWDGPALELTAGEGNTGKYTACMTHLPEAKFTSLILLHELVVAPNYGGKSTTFLIRTSEEQAIAKLKQHITELVNVPVFDSWASYLWHTGQTAGLVHKTRAGGDIELFTISLDIDAWTRLITGGIEQHVIALP
jgi:hypothetical protein